MDDWGGWCKPVAFFYLCVSRVLIVVSFFSSCRSCEFLLQVVTVVVTIVATRFGEAAIRLFEKHPSGAKAHF
jgi:hypothetical protein